jgi:hypothetical protein
MQECKAIEALQWVRVKWDIRLSRAGEIKEHLWKAQGHRVLFQEDYSPVSI